MFFDFSRLLYEITDGTIDGFVQSLKEGFPFVEHNRLNDGTLERITTIRCGGGAFKFVGSWYRVTDFEDATVVIVYSDREDQYRSLVRDKYGRLWFHAFDSEPLFNDVGDREDETWTLVQSEEDAERFIDKHGFSLLIEPYLYMDETGRSVAHEIVG